MKPSRQTRDRAILFAQIAASNPNMSDNDIAGELDMNLSKDPAYMLFCAAFADNVFNNPYFVEHPEAETECLLREGWTP